jgi:hypothetical protein
MDAVVGTSLQFVSVSIHSTWQSRLAVSNALSSLAQPGVPIHRLHTEHQHDSQESSIISTRIQI